MAGKRAVKRKAVKRPNYKEVFSKHDRADERAEYAAIIWETGFTELDNRGLVTGPRLLTLDRYVRAQTEYKFLYSEAMADGPTCKSDGGNDYANMKWSAVGKLNEQIMKFEDALRFRIDEAAPPPPKDAPKTPADEFLD